MILLGSQLKTGWLSGRLIYFLAMITIKDKWLSQILQWQTQQSARQSQQTVVLDSGTRYFSSRQWCQTVVHLRPFNDSPKKAHNIYLYPCIYMTPCYGMNETNEVFVLKPLLHRMAPDSKCGPAI